MKPDSHAEQRNGREEAAWGGEEGEGGERGEETLPFLQLHLPPGVKPQVSTTGHDQGAQGHLCPSAQG